METPTGPRGNRLLVLLVLPFYLAWSAMRSLASALTAAADRAAELIARALRALGDLLRPIAAGLMTLVRAVGRILAWIGHQLAHLARMLRWAFDATVGRVLGVVFDWVGRFLVLLARAIAPVARQLVTAIVRLATNAAELVVKLARAIGGRIGAVVALIGSVVGPPLARAVAGVRHLLRQLAAAFGRVARAAARRLDAAIRAIGAIFAAIGTRVRPVVAKAVAGVRALIGGLARTLARAVTPVAVGVRRLTAELMSSLSPLGAALAAAARDARRSVRQIAGLPEVPQPNERVRARTLPRGVYLMASADDAPASPTAVSSRRSSAGSIAATTTVMLLPLVIGYDLLALSDATVAIAIVLGVGFLVGLVHFRARGRDAVIGFGLGTAAVVAFQAITAPLLHFTVTGSPIAGWLGSTIIGLLAVYAGFLVGDVTAPRTPHLH